MFKIKYAQVNYGQVKVKIKYGQIKYPLFNIFKEKPFRF